MSLNSSRHNENKVKTDQAKRKRVLIYAEEKLLHFFDEDTIAR